MNGAFARGVRLFDEGAYFEAHEAWEVCWQAETDPDRRRFFQGLIQIAAGCHKLVVVRSEESAARLLAKGLAKIEATAKGGASAALIDGVRRCVHGLTEGRVAVPVLGDAAALFDCVPTARDS